MKQEKLPLFFLVFVLGCLYTEGAQAQQNRFRATLISGINLSQIDGDLQKGYRHQAYNIGLSSAIIFKPNFDISLEAFYNQKGARPSPQGTQTSRINSSIDLNYADIVGLFNFHAFPHRSKEFYTQTIKIGFSYGRLLSSHTDIKYNNIRLTEYEQIINKGLLKEDISLVLGMSWQLNPRWGIMFRHTNSLKRIYQKEQPLPSSVSIPNTEKDFRYLMPYNFSLQVFYHFVSPHKAVGIIRNAKNGGGDPLEEL